MTTRRSFLSKLALGVAGFTILPAATTYARSWKKTEAGLYAVNPDWVDAPYEMTMMYSTKDFNGTWKWVDVPLVLAWRKGATFKEFGIT